jgi:transposase
MPAGRPTLYKPEYCDQVIEMFKKGMSKFAIALKLDVNVDTLAEWQKVHPEFSAAVKKGLDFSQGNWEERGRLNLKNKDFNSTLWIMNMKNRFRKDWGDHQTVTQITTHKLHDQDIHDLEEVKKAYKKEL